MMNKNKKPRKSYAYGSMVRKPMQMGGTAMSANPMMPRTQQGMGMNMPKMAGGGKLKEPNNPGLKKLPKPVRNKMGYMAYGGKMKKMAEGGKLMETRQEIKDRVSKKDPDLSKSQLSRAFNIARGMDPAGRLSEQDIERVIKALKDPSNRRSSRD